jgi:hypothetical protein
VGGLTIALVDFGMALSMPREQRLRIGAPKAKN